MSFRKETIEGVTHLCTRLGRRIEQMSGGVFDADDAASDMVAGAIACFDKIEPRQFADEAAIVSAANNAVHRDYQDMVRLSTNTEPDPTMPVAGNVSRQARGSLRAVKDPADAVAPAVDVALQTDVDAQLAAMDAVNEEICRRLMDGENRAEICRELKLTPATYDTRISSIRFSMRSLNENQDAKGSV